MADMLATTLRSLRNVTLLVAPCSALALGGCFSDPPLPGTSDTAQGSSTGAMETGSSGQPGSASTEPDPSVSTSGGTSTGPDPTRGSTGQTTFADSSSSGGSASSTSGSVVGCKPFLDEFDGDDAAQGWDYTDPDNINVIDDEVELTVTPQIMDVNKMEIPGGWTGEGVTVTVELGQVSGSFVNQMIRFTSTDDAPDLVAFRVQGQPAGPLLQVWHATNNEDFVEAITEPFNPLEHRWLRVSETGDVLVFETSGDGTNFLEFFVLEDTFDLSGAAVGIAVTNFQVLDESETVSFASFRLTCPE